MKKVKSILTAVFLFTALAACGGGGGGDGGSGSNNDINESLSGSLNETDGDLDGAYTDFYVIKNVPKGAWIWAEVDPSGFDAVLMLYYGDGEDGDLVRTEDSNDGGENESFFIEADETGQYVIFVSSYDAGETGTYTLRYSVTEDVEESDDSDDDDDDDNDDDNDDGDDDDDDTTCRNSEWCGVCGHFSYLSCSCVSDFYCSVK